MGKYPVFLELEGKRAVIIGGGAVAARKAQMLLAAKARLVIVAEEIDNILAAQCPATAAELVKSKYSKNYLTGATLVIAATNDRQLNERIHKDCQELEILCNVVDEPELCDFFVPAVVKRGDLQIAVSTEGDCPAYAGHIKKKLESIFTEKHGEFLTELEILRKDIIKNISNPDRRKAVLGQLADDESFEYFTQNGPAKWRLWAEGIIRQPEKK
jgi:precorrin-2 dehydrogenase/sirohydrochlorin ferrochelatase